MALPLTETDVFQSYEKAGANLGPRMKALITNPQAAVVVNEKLEEATLSRFAISFKEPIALKALMAVRTGELVLFVARPEFNLPECIPYFRYVSKGKTPKVAVNLTNICIVDQGSTSAETTYMVEDMRKLYAMLVSAYLQLRLPDPVNYPIKAIEFGAMMWARMFCKVLNRTIGLATNKERYEAYFYFAARFYLEYLIGAPSATINSISTALLKNGTKSPLITMIEDRISAEKINMNANFTTFCSVLFNNDLSGAKGMRMAAANPNEKLNVSFFIKRFVDTYNQAAIMSLASAQYFTWMIVCCMKKAFMCNIKMLSDVVESTEGARYLAALFEDAAR